MTGTINLSEDRDACGPGVPLVHQRPTYQPSTEDPRSRLLTIARFAFEETDAHGWWLYLTWLTGYALCHLTTSHVAPNRVTASTMDGDDQEYTEPSIIEYARFHGLARDHLSVNPLCSGHIPLLHTLEFLDSREPNGSFSQDHLPAFALNEQTSLDEDAQSLLAKATSGPTGTGNRVEDTADHRRIKKLKLELPITRTDHDLDMRDFALQYEPDLSRLNFPMVQVDEENDEGMTWPSYVYDFVNRSNYSQLFEKLSATKDDLLYLQAICRDDTQQSDTNSLEKGLLIHRTVRNQYFASAGLY